MPIVDAASAQAAAISVPYRSTLKKFQACWTGDLPGTVQGSAKLIDPNWIAGKITNGTDRNFRNVYVAFKHPTIGGRSDDWILYLPTWDAGVTLDLENEYNKNADGSRVANVDVDNRPDGKRKMRGSIRLGWGTVLAHRPSRQQHDRLLR